MWVEDGQVSGPRTMGSPVSKARNRPLTLESGKNLRWGPHLPPHYTFPYLPLSPCWRRQQEGRVRPGTHRTPVPGLSRNDGPKSPSEDKSFLKGVQEGPPARSRPVKSPCLYVLCLFPIFSTTPFTGVVERGGR